MWLLRFPLLRNTRYESTELAAIPWLSSPGAPVIATTVVRTAAARRARCPGGRGSCRHRDQTDHDARRSRPAPGGRRLHSAPPSARQRVGDEPSASKRSPGWRRRNHPPPLCESRSTRRRSPAPRVHVRAAAGAATTSPAINGTRSTPLRHREPAAAAPAPRVPPPRRRGQCPVANNLVLFVPLSAMSTRAPGRASCTARSIAALRSLIARYGVSISRRAARSRGCDRRASDAALTSSMICRIF